MNKLFYSFMMTAIVLFASFDVKANMDAGLYDPLPPEGAAFVRFINAAGKKGSVQTGANGKGYDYLEHREVSPYFVVDEGKADVNFGEVKHSFDVKAGSFYTVVYTEGLDVIEDESNDNRAKAQIIFYNLSDKDKLALKANEGKVAVIDEVEKGSAKARQINPVKVELSVYEGEAKLKDAEPLSMERGMAYSAIFTGEADDVLWVRSTTNTRR